MNIILEFEFTLYFNKLCSYFFRGQMVNSSSLLHAHDRYLYFTGLIFPLAIKYSRVIDD